MIKVIKLWKVSNLFLRKNSEYFFCDFKKTANLDKLYLIPEINKGLYNVLGRPVIPNYESSTEKSPEFLDFYKYFLLKSLRGFFYDICKCGWSKSKDTTF